MISNLKPSTAESWDLTQLLSHIRKEPLNSCTVFETDYNYTKWWNYFLLVLTRSILGITGLLSTDLILQIIRGQKWPYQSKDIYRRWPHSWEHQCHLNYSKTPVNELVPKIVHTIFMPAILKTIFFLIEMIFHNICILTFTLSTLRISSSRSDNWAAEVQWIQSTGLKWRCER